MAKLQPASVTALVPLKYAQNNNSTYFDVSGTLVSVAYEVQVRKKYRVLATNPLATVSVEVSNLEKLAQSYELPKNGAVGEEIASVEQGLYGLMDKVLRSIVQSRVAEQAQKEMKALEQENFFGGAATWREYLKRVKGSEQDHEHNPKAQEYAVLNEITERLLTAVTYVTQLNSINREGLEQYQQKYTRSLERLLEKEHLPANTKELLNSVIDFLGRERLLETDVYVAQQKVLEYLRQVEPQEKGLITAEKARIILEDFVGGNLAIRRRLQQYEPTLPQHFVGHSLRSFFVGGFVGWVALSGFAEALVNGFLTTKINIPGWEIGAATVFAWPYVRYPLAKARATARTKKELSDLLTSVERKLLALPAEEKGIAEYVLPPRPERTKKISSSPPPRKKSLRKANVMPTKVKPELQPQPEYQDRAAYLNHHLPDLFQMYSSVKDPYDDEVQDIEAAVIVTKETLSNNNVPIEHAYGLIEAFAGGMDNNAREIARATTKVVQKLAVVPQYDFDKVLAIIRTVRLQDPWNDCSPEQIASSVVKLLGE